MTNRPPEVDWANVDAVIFDVDGTLFDLSALRRYMFWKLLRHFLVTGRTQDLRIVMTFRDERDKLARSGEAGIAGRQYEVVADKIGLPITVVESVVERWIYLEPLAYIPRCAPTGARQFVDVLKSAGIKVGVFSDYPATEKLAALAIPIEVALDATMPSIGLLKPDPAGFLKTAEALGVAANRCLVIGDRPERDGMAAKAGGFPFVKVIARAGKTSGYESMTANVLQSRGVLP